MFILIVEDEPQMARNLAELLENEGHQYDMAHTIADARAKVAARPPDAVFLDMHLPDGSGFDLMNTSEGLRYVVITGTPEQQMVDDAFDRGVVAYLVKPFSLGDVLDAIAQLDSE